MKTILIKVARWIQQRYNSTEIEFGDTFWNQGVCYKINRMTKSFHGEHAISIDAEEASSMVNYYTR